MVFANTLILASTARTSAEDQITTMTPPSSLAESNYRSIKSTCPSTPSVSSITSALGTTPTTTPNTSTYTSTTSSITRKAEDMIPLSTLLSTSSGYQRIDSILSLQELMTPLVNHSTKTHESFQEKQSEFNTFELIKIESIINDLRIFINFQLSTFNKIESSTMQNKDRFLLEWVYEGRVEILKIYRAVMCSYKIRTYVG
ncbi:unnamed protein product [Ambrosiozyma monospora]|uniref:Unnamed protein product n=1 Tax=Ambrosiozyma monospora TaxID=43982 RepID=A0A9W6YQG1_AMBMO|nr:unnamed protein product [Ambrosiozyma monospora]